MWGLLNENFGGEMLRYAVESLDLVRTLDSNRVVIFELVDAPTIKSVLVLSPIPVQRCGKMYLTKAIRTGACPTAPMSSNSCELSAIGHILLSELW